MSQLLAYVRPIQLQEGKYDLLVRELCIPEPPRGVTRLSELLARGYQVTAMSPHPDLKATLIVALQPPEAQPGMMKGLLELMRAAPKP